jgi:hypothetical protein
LPLCNEHLASAILQRPAKILPGEMLSAKCVFWKGNRKRGTPGNVSFPMLLFREAGGAGVSAGTLGACDAATFVRVPLTAAADQGIPAGRNCRKLNSIIDAVRRNDHLTDFQLFLFHDVANCGLVAHDRLVDPAVMVGSPEIHDSPSTCRTHEITVRSHLEIAGD